MSGGEVIGAIGAVIGILQASGSLWKHAQKDINFSKTFSLAADGVPILQAILQTCLDHVKQSGNGLPEDEAKAIIGTMKTCEMKAEQLKQIFEETIPGDADKWFDRYRKVAHSLGKGSTVEEILAFMVRQAQILTNYDVVKSNASTLRDRLDRIAQKLEDAEPSIPYSSNTMTINASGGQQNINSGSGTQNIKHGNVYGQGDGNTFNFGKGS